MVIVEEMDNEITLTLPLGMELEGLDLGRNLSALYGDGVQAAGENMEPVPYEQFLADVWIGIVLTLMVLSCVCCMCSCLLYHKFQQWKRNVLMTRNGSNVESGGNPETESLPSYTVVSGLPSYEEALEQLKKVKELTGGGGADSAKNLSSAPPASTTDTPVTRLSVTDLFQIYKLEGAGSGKNST